MFNLLPNLVELEIPNHKFLLAAHLAAFLRADLLGLLETLLEDVLEKLLGLVGVLVEQEGVGGPGFQNLDADWSVFRHTYSTNTK